MVLVVLVFTLTYLNGTNDISKGIATLVGGKVLWPAHAIAWGTITTAAGALAGVAITGGLLKTFSTGILSQPLQTTTFPLAVTIGAAAWILFASRTGLPVSTTHALAGGIIGAALARKYQDAMAQKIGAPNVEFHKGNIQDLRLDLEEVDEYLRRHPIRMCADLQLLEEYGETLRKNAPLIEDNSIDVVVSNCVLNLVKEEDRRQLFAEIFRVLKVGGRAAISDIVSDEEVPESLKNDPELWSGCISGAFTEPGFLQAFEDAGFYGMEIVKRDDKPWQTIEGIEFRSVTVVAHKGKQGPCYERNQAVIYKGPWKAVIDDDGHTLFRGERMAVCDKTIRLYTQQESPYTGDLIAVEPYNEISLETAKSFNCSKNARRHPKETKGQDYKVTEMSEGSCCGPDGCC